MIGQSLGLLLSRTPISSVSVVRMAPATEVLDVKGNGVVH